MYPCTRVGVLYTVAGLSVTKHQRGARGGSQADEHHGVQQVRTNTCVIVSSTRMGVSSTLVGVSSPRVGVSSTRVGVSSTRVGVPDTGARVSITENQRCPRGGSQEKGHPGRHANSVRLVKAMRPGSIFWGQEICGCVRFRCKSCSNRVLVKPLSSELGTHRPVTALA